MINNYVVVWTLVNYFLVEYLHLELFIHNDQCMLDSLLKLLSTFKNKCYIFKTSNVRRMHYALFSIKQSIINNS